MPWICYWIDPYNYWDVFYLKFEAEEVIQIAAQRHAKTFGRECKYMLKGSLLMHREFIELLERRSLERVK